MVNRNIGTTVATWTAEAISGSGLRLVVSQFITMSNITMPTLEIEPAARMTVKARLANMPQREGPGAAAFDEEAEELFTKSSWNKNRALFRAPDASEWQGRPRQSWADALAVPEARFGRRSHAIVVTAKAPVEMSRPKLRQDAKSAVVNAANPNAGRTLGTADSSESRA